MRMIPNEKIDLKLINLLIDLEHYVLRELSKNGYIGRVEGCLTCENPYFKVTIGFPRFPKKKESS